MEDEEASEDVEGSVPLEELCSQIVDCGFKVHQALGPGLLESAYENCLWRELTSRGFAAERQVALPIMYKGLQTEGAYRLDLIVEGQVVIELKSVEGINGLHRSQLKTYLKLSGYPVGFLMNFNVNLYKDGLRRLNRPPPSRS